MLDHQAYLISVYSSFGTSFLNEFILFIRALA
jgi:hypothetical protein